ncbi:MAG: hypothetical protein Q4B15_03265 [Lachnospiraceae bacterium]|nr:hypothetical protein [Lachnospiraceae bacterium]
MRYDEKVLFVLKGDRTYDKATGDYSEPELSTTEMMASVMDTGNDALQLVYGKLREGSLTVHLPVDAPEVFSHIEIRGRKYHADKRRNLRHGCSFIVSEVP